MQVSRRLLLGGAAALSTVPLLRAHAQAKPKIRLGVLTDLSGTYRDNTGPGSVACTRQAVTEFNPSAHGFDVEVISADHQNKPDVAATIAREWCDQGVDALRRRADIVRRTGGGAGGEGKGQNHAERVGHHDGSDGRAVQPQHHRLEFRHLHDGAVQGRFHCEGGRQDLVFHHRRLRLRPILEEQTAALVKKAGGKVQGRAALSVPRHHRFCVLSAAGTGSGAQVLGLANAGLDTVNSIKQAHEFGLNKR